MNTLEDMKEGDDCVFDSVSCQWAIGERSVVINIFGIVEIDGFA